MGQNTALNAARQIPSLTKEEWCQSGTVTRWMVASRAAVLVMTLSSAALGGVLALLDGMFDPVAWLLCATGLMLAHAASNQLNDLVDSGRGVDKDNYFRNQYGTHVLEDGLLTRRALMAYIGCTGAIALSIGLLLVWLKGPMVLLPLAGGAFFLLLYTYPLKQLGLGELSVLLVWGPLMTGGAYLATTGTWNWQVLLVGTVYALAPTAVIFGKHIDKLDFDLAKGIRTLPVRLGDQLSRYTAIGITIVQYASIPVLAVLDILPWTALLIVIAIPSAIRMIKIFLKARPAEPPAEFPEAVWPLWYVAFAFSHTRLFGGLFFAGLLISWVL